MARSYLLKLVVLWLLSGLFCFAYEVPVVDNGQYQSVHLVLFLVSHLSPDYSRQICSGMWGSHSTYINGILGFM